MLALQKADAIAKAPGAEFQSLRAWIVLTRGEVALFRGDHASAAAEVGEALTLAGPEYREIFLIARCIQALAQAREGKAAAATELANDAVATARELGVPQLVSRSLLSSAEVHLLREDSAVALSQAREAQRLCADAAQLDSEWRAWLFAGLALRLAGNSAEAYDAAASGESRRSALQSRMGSDFYNTYSARPDIKIFLNQLQELLQGS